MEHIKFNLRYCEFQFINNFVMELYQLSGNYADETMKEGATEQPRGWLMVKKAMTLLF